MLIVQESSGLYYAVQYDGTNGQEIIDALRATDYTSTAGVISFRAFIMRAGGLLTSGHRFSVPLGYWIVWADEGNPYVIAPPLTTAVFEQQYQVAATAAEVAALSATVSALGLTVTALNASLVVTNTNVTNLSAALATTNTNVSTLAAAVVTLDTDVHNIDASWIVSGILPYQRLAGTIPENATIVLFNRPTLVTPGTALDCWRWLYNGNRTVYGNEFNLLRVRGVPEDQVPARFMSNAARDGLSTAILHASLSDAVSHMFQVLGNGDILAAGGLSMLPTAPVAVAFNGAAGTANAVTISDGSASGTPYPVTTIYCAADNRVYLNGSVANPTGVSIPGGTTLFTITAAHRPAFWAQFPGRTSTVLATRITVKPTGAVVLDQALAAGATLSFDGHNWQKA
jgi:hypothetical protein